MKILHIAPHLGGGVGKAHATLAEAAGAAKPVAISHSYALLEAPRDVGYVERVAAAGWPVQVVADQNALDALIAEADIVQVEWWNHPRLYALLASNRLPPLRLVLWVHISGLAPPLVPAGLASLADFTLFTSPCSLGAPNLKRVISARPEAFGVANSGFGFAAPPRGPRPQGPMRIGYMGTLDFIKMHPGVFDVIDAVESDIHVSFFGYLDPAGEVAARAAAMRRPERVRFEGYAADPQAELSKLDVFFYPLSTGHYGTAENVLVEAMSVGAMPIVWNNASETAIVCQERTGIVVGTPEACVERLEWACADPERVARIGQAAAAAMRRSRTPRATLHTFAETYGAVMDAPRRSLDFAGVLGCDARTWFLSSLRNLDDAVSDQACGVGRLLSNMTSKGSLGHFRTCFPEDTSLAAYSLS